MPCIDGDGDGFGVDCDPGPDCDDRNFLVPRPEQCNGIDDDCDGFLDEGLAIGEPCMRGACEGTLQCDRSGFDEVRCAVAEVDGCNGVDDDCDGEVDEDEAFLGACVTDHIGRCAAGEVRCRAGALGCVPVIEPATLDEICNGLDDDCDAIVDEVAEAPPCYPGPPGTEGVGRCRAGARRCEAGRHVSCVDAITPRPERCDGSDDDCDGAVDEGLDCGCAEGAVRPCGPRAPGVDGLGHCVAGEQRCVGAGWGACDGASDPRPELCDGVDDDCDGLIDERPAGVDLPCTTGQGWCAAAGLLICEGGRLRCDAESAQPQPDRCYARDDWDCDGVAGAPREVGRACEVDGQPGIWLCRSGLECVPVE